MIRERIASSIVESHSARDGMSDLPSQLKLVEKLIAPRLGPHTRAASVEILPEAMIKRIVGAPV